MKSRLSYEELLDLVNKYRKELDEKSLEMNHLKHSFLSIISHELRTPMHAILGFSRLLTSDELSREEKEEYFDYINQCSNNLLNLINNLIDASLIENAELELSQRACYPNRILEELHEKFQKEKHRMKKFNIALLKTSQFEDPDFKISTDQIRLEQVLSNLLHNALKFTDKGIIEFGFFIRDDNKLQFFVTDTGKGCKRDPLLFESFYRKHDNTSDQLPGAGLGLSISHGLVKLLGGTIWVEDNDYNGSTFNFTIPMSDDSELPSMGDNKRDNDYLHFVF